MELLGASTNPGLVEHKADNGFAISSNAVSQDGDLPMVGEQTNPKPLGNSNWFTKPTYSASVIVNRKYNGWKILTTQLH